MSSEGEDNLLQSVFVEVQFKEADTLKNVKETVWDYLGHVTRNTKANNDLLVYVSGIYDRDKDEPINNW